MSNCNVKLHVMRHDIGERSRYSD